MGHLTAETVQRLVKSEILPEERNEAVRHLLAQCPHCVRIAQNAAAGAGLFDPGRPFKTPRPEEGERKDLDAIFDRLEAGLKEITERVKQAQLLAARQWATLHWLMGKLNQSLGNLREAEEIFQRMATYFLKRGLPQEYLLCGLELATVVYAQGNRTRTLQILSSLYRWLEFWHMPTERLAVFLLFISLLKQDDI